MIMIIKFILIYISSLATFELLTGGPVPSVYKSEDDE